MATEQTAAETSARDAILAALERLLETQKLDEIRVAHILEEAKTSRATFYFYFSGKDEAFVALLHDVIEAILPALQAAMDARDPDNPRAAVRRAIAGYLTLGGTRELVIRSAIEEWPRSAEVRSTYFEGVDGQIAILTKVIDEDRAAGRAPDGVPSPQLASGVLWTMERVWYASVTASEGMEDKPAIAAAIGDIVAAAIYGRD